MKRSLIAAGIIFGGVLAVGLVLTLYVRIMGEALLGWLVFAAMVSIIFLILNAISGWVTTE